MEDKNNNPFAPYELQIQITERKEMIASMMYELRRSKGYQQKEISELLGISAQTYNGYEKARNEPPVEILIRLSFLYNVTLDTLTQRNVFFNGIGNAMPEIEKYEAEIKKMREQLAEDGSNSEVLNPLIDVMEKLASAMKSAVSDKKE